MLSKTRRHSRCVLLLVAVSATAGAQEPTDSEAAWVPIRMLEGTWRGEIDGILGQGTGLRSYEVVLDGKYVMERHASIRIPQEKSPRGDHHREIGIYSWDSERETIVLRSFNVEGFVLRSPCEVEPTKVVCTSESVESGSGMKSRLTLTMIDAYRFDETFELASPGQELQVYFNIRWTKVPDLNDVTVR